MQLRRNIALLSVALLVFASSVAFGAPFNTRVNQTTPAKPADSISGKYQGVAKSDQIGDIAITVDLKNDNGKLSGKIDSAQGSFAITSGTFADGKLSMKFDAGGNVGTVDATVSGDKISGKWEIGGQGGPLELKKADAATAAGPSTTPTPAPAGPATAGDPISGEWDASAEAQGMTIPFTLKLKLEGDKVTGTSDSAQGSATISKGTYNANKLTFSLDTPQGPLNMNAMLKEGKLVGEFDFAGQMTGKWEAKKK
ncbi:MAG TPA: hypothetical protein VJZ26_15375 [Blastocatellia bacterium]|nr:hypothetical protein [Blastocatellia bacterium]